MKLDLDTSHRAYLRASRALTSDADGNETLVGLTRAEAIEYLLVMSGPSIGANLDRFDDPRSFFRLYDRHITALMSRPYFSSRDIS